jgi:hypothetical protein
MTISGCAELTLQEHDSITLARFYTRGLGLTEFSREPTVHTVCGAAA